MSRRRVAAAAARSLGAGTASEVSRKRLMPGGRVPARVAGECRPNWPHHLSGILLPGSCLVIDKETEIAPMCLRGAEVPASFWHKSVPVEKCFE